MKPSVVLISSSSDDDNDDEEELESVDDSDYSESDDREYNDDDENDDESDDEEYVDNCDRVVSIDQGSNDSLELSLNDCKEYLRKHRLRLSGTKEECVQRIKEHGRLKDGSGESLYPRSSFSINCTGDACKGDVVLFRQKVYKKLGNIVGKRTVAGRIVKESYGASKQQHTFTVEVLWSKPSKNLPPLSTLLVKGRNLYRLGTFRQPWKNEAERSKVLGEKHTRGEAARHKRTLRTQIPSHNDKGRKRQKLSHGGPSQSKQPTQINKHKSTKRMGADPVNKKDVRFQKTERKRSKQPTFKPNPNRSMYSDHHIQEASSSSFSYDTTSLPNLPSSFGFSGYGLYNHQQPRPNHALNQPRGYYHYNYEQPVPRYRFG